eukprot:1157400-Pelagomonas_calceolata.AAC.2
MPFCQVWAGSSTPLTLWSPLKELGLDTHEATKLALKLHAHLSSTHVNLLAPDMLLKRLLSTLVNKVRQGVLLVIFLIPTDFFPLGGSGGDAWCLQGLELGPRYPLFLS